MRPRVRLPAVVALLIGTGLAALGALAFTGAAAVPVLADSGAVVRWGTPVVEGLQNLLASLTIGALALAVCVLPRGSTRRGRDVVDGRAYAAGLSLAGVAAIGWTLAAVLDLVLTFSRASRTPVSDPAFGEQLAAFVGQVSLGRIMLATIVIAAVVAVLALAVTTPTGAAWTAALALSALAVQSVTGHSAGNASHELAISSLFLHLTGAALWIGILLALALLAGHLGDDVAAAVSRFSLIAGWCLAAVAVSGVANAFVRVGDWSGMTTRYGELILVKVVLLAALGGIGLAHRRVVVHRLAGATKSRARSLLWRLVVVELAVMGLVSGVAVGLSSSEPPVPDALPSAPTPAEIVTGHRLPPELTAGQWIAQWRWDVLLASACVAALVVYVRWVVRLHRRGDAWPVKRTVSWVSGILIMMWVTNGGPAVYGHMLFSAHMVQHMILAMVVPLFLTLAAPVTLALRALPSRPDASRGPREWILTLVSSHVGRLVASPLFAAANFAGSMIVFYYTDAFRLALTTYVGHVLMTVHFTLVGYLFANALVGVDPGPKRPGFAQRLLLLFATMAFHAFFGVALMSGEALLVPDWFGLMGRDWGLSAIADQQQGGGIAWSLGELPTLGLAIAVAIAWSRDDERTARRRDRKVERDGDTELDEYNAMLADLERRRP